MCATMGIRVVRSTMVDGIQFTSIEEAITHINQQEDSYQQMLKHLSQQIMHSIKSVESMAAQHENSGENSRGRNGQRKAKDEASGVHRQPQMKPLKLEFLRFDGDNPTAWIY